MTAGAIALDGRLVVRTTVAGVDTTLVRIARIVRDAQTGIGKGFAFVAFTDRAAVAEALKLRGSRLHLGLTGQCTHLIFIQRNR